MAGVDNFVVGGRIRSGAGKGVKPRAGDFLSGTNFDYVGRSLMDTN